MRKPVHKHDRWGKITTQNSTGSPTNNPKTHSPVATKVKKRNAGHTALMTVALSFLFVNPPENMVCFVIVDRCRVTTKAREEGWPKRRPSRSFKYQSPNCAPSAGHLLDYQDGGGLRMVRGANYGVRDLSGLEPNLKFRGQAPTFQ